MSKQIKFMSDSFVEITSDDFKDFELVLSLNYPPTANERLKPKVNYQSQTCRLVSTKVVRTYKNVAKLQILKLFKLINHKTQDPYFQMPNELEIKVLVFPPDKRYRDLDNIPKVLFDTLQYCNVIANDVQFSSIILKRANMSKIELNKKILKDLHKRKCLTKKFKYEGGVVLGIRKLLIHDSFLK